MRRVDAQDIWGKEFLPDIELIDEILTRLDLKPGSPVLDIGTGWGIMAISLAARGFEVTTGEPEGNAHGHGREGSSQGDPTSGEYGDWRRSAAALGVRDRIRSRPLNAEALPFPSDSFYGVFLYDTLQHVQPLQDRERAISECLRVRTLEGVLCVIETNDAGVEHYRKQDSFEIQRLDPRNYLGGTHVQVEVWPGELSDAFLIRHA